MKKLSRKKGQNEIIAKNHNFTAKEYSNKNKTYNSNNTETTILMKIVLTITEWNSSKLLKTLINK